jgi:hypothetical protein
MSIVAFEAFKAFPVEANIVGQLVVSYGELEFLLALAVGNVMDDHTQAIRTLFRSRGEEQRIMLADALARPGYTAGRLGLAFEEAINAMQHCRAIRNQFAHAHWTHNEHGLLFFSLEKQAKKPTGEIRFKSKPIFRDVLEVQKDWFRYTGEYLLHLGALWDWRKAGLSSPWPKPPEKGPKPPLDSSPSK